VRVKLKDGHPAIALNGQAVTFGIRPEDIYHAESNVSIPVSEANTFEAHLDVLEKLGAEDTAYLMVGDQPMIATLDPAHPVAVGSTAKFAFDLDRIHIFHGEDGAAVR